MRYYDVQSNVLSPRQLSRLWEKVNASSYFTTNNLNRDFVNTKGFSLVFTREGLPQVEKACPFFKSYLERALQPDCNAFYLNPLLLSQGSRVDPHIDRSLRSYCKTIDPPWLVSVLYVRLPDLMEGGELMLSLGKKQVGKITPQANTLVFFQGDLTHSVNALKTKGQRLSIVCEQYCLTTAQLEAIPRFTIESRAYTPQR